MQHLVKDVERPLVFRLTGGPGLFQEVLSLRVKDVHTLISRKQERKTEGAGPQ